jgi:hypothetical protein
LSEARKQYESKRGASRVVLFDAFEKWREFREEHCSKTDQNVRVSSKFLFHEEHV